LSDLLPIVIAAIGSSALTQVVNAIINQRKSNADTRKSNADADNVVVDTSSDLVAMAKSIYESRIVALEKQAKEDHETIVGLNKDVGKLRQAGEAQSKRIMELEGQVALWKGYAKELVALLRSHSIQLPKWAEAIGGK